ncbi:ABC transporter substrate-binding protein [Thermovenabulum gondwanense]|uniref:Leucine-, isoleucine-, valine-, threonine-, and alanine-binding protein n=1 Tax=Thermovenabulum gondwanense TaxID=520767 RepID=A0A162MS74_9FIRM|nr:ABC transporter substrate-binding protein [Thermovenabulum gondwanense]KYO67061.1 Leucine-, isoleucine-, valine-, threonine-, and alanine-binding protein [Thermovenabulum gondwanense]
MKISRKISILLIAIILLLIFTSACSSNTSTSSQNNQSKESDFIKIGHLVALTGDASMWGQSEKNALEMEVEKINKSGGINGKQIKIIAYDTRADAVEAVNAAKRLVEQDKVIAIIGPAQSGVSNAISSVTEQAKIPFIATTATNPLVTVPKEGQVRKYAFRVCFIDPFQGRVAAQFAYTKLNAKKAAILYDVGSDYSSWLAKYFEDSFKEIGGDIVAKEAFRSGELDYRAMLGKIKQANPEVIFIPTAQKEAALAAKQARDLGIKATFLGGDNWGSPDLVTLGGSAVEGAYFVNLTAIEDPDIQGFIKEYKEKFNQDPVLPNPVMAIDALYMLIDAIKRAGSLDGMALAEAMEKTKDLKVLTGNLTIDPATHNPLNKPAIIQQVKDGKFIYVEKYVTH